MFFKHDAAVKLNPGPARGLTHVQLEPGKDEPDRNLIDDVDLARVQPRPQALGRKLELEHCRTPSGRVEAGTLDDRRCRIL